MELAGIYYIKLWEGKGINPLYNSNGNIESILNTGDTYTIDNCQEIKFNYSIILNRNAKKAFSYNLEFFIYDLTDVNIDQILKFKQSIYGWYPEIYFYNNDRRFLNSPLSFDNSETPNNSNSFKASFSNVVPTRGELTKVDPITCEGIGCWIIENTFIVQI